MLLAENEYPWLFVVKSSDGTSQLFNTFPVLVASALQIDQSEVKTYGLQVYQPASWNGDEASLLTQWLAYIPSQYFDTLNAYIKTSNSPLYNQTGIQGQLAAQINTAFPLAASGGSSTSTDGSSSGGNDKRKRNIIIGVSVGIGGALWVALVFWIYKRVKRSNDKAVHRRLSEHMSVFDGQHATYGAAGSRLSRTSSIAASEIDDRPSSFYASPFEDHSFGQSVVGNTWFAQPPSRQQTQHQNPFEDIVTRSYLTTSGSRELAQRKSTAVQKGMISQPTLQNNSLEFSEPHAR